MVTSKRRISYFTLEVSEEIDVTIKEFLMTLINDICSKDKRERKYNISNERFCFLQKADIDNDIVKCLFISAKHGTRLPLINKENLETRDNPKTKQEGEEEHTHLLLKISDEECFALLENGRDLLIMKNICEYFNVMYKKNNEVKINPVSFSIIPSDSFEETLNKKITRLSLGEIYIDKQLLGEESLDFSNRIETVKEDMVLQIRPERKKDIKDVLVDIFKKWSTQQTHIKRIRIKGKTETGADCFADTQMSLIKRREIEIQKDEETGAVNSNYIFSQMTDLSRNL